jgi:D-serine deaminase-like pyridoxal phosphate-dependent protein
MTIFDLPTPFVALDINRVHANIGRMAALASSADVRLRPHTKTHKSPVIAQWQMDAGAIGVCCAKLSEAEIFAAAGIENIRLPYPIQPVNADRLVSLSERAQISIIVDNVAVAHEWSHVMARRGLRLDVLVKIDVGFHRCGMNPDDEHVSDDIQRIAELPGLTFHGLLSYAGQAAVASSEDEIERIARDEATLLNRIACELKRRGVAVNEISVGGTPTSRYITRQPGVTEMRPGNYVFLDRMQVGLGTATVADCAMTVVSTVVSRPARDRLIFDAGSKTLSSDGARGFAAMPGFGLVLRELENPTPDPSIVIERLSEEHGTARVPEDCSLTPGDRVRILPNHACVVTNLMDTLHLVNETKIVSQLPVAARGKIW